MAEQVVSLVDVVGSPMCVASEDGEKVYREIVRHIEHGDSVRLSFAGVEDLTSAFLNSAVGQLYGRFSEEQIRAAVLPPIGASDDDLFLLKRVVDRAKDFFRDPEKYHKAAIDVMGDNSDEPR